MFIFFFLPSAFFAFSVCAAHSDFVVSDFRAGSPCSKNHMAWFCEGLPGGCSGRFPIESSEGESGEIFVSVGCARNGDANFLLNEKYHSHSRNFFMDVRGLRRASIAECSFQEDTGRESLMTITAQPFFEGVGAARSGRMFVVPPFGEQTETVTLPDIRRNFSGVRYVCRADKTDVDWVWIVFRAFNDETLFLRLHIDYADISQVTTSWGKARCDTCLSFCMPGERRAFRSFTTLEVYDCQKYKF